MDYILNGMKMDRRCQKEITRMGKEMDYGLGGMIMDRSIKKELTRMGKGLILNHLGTNMYNDEMIILSDNIYSDGMIILSDRYGKDVWAGVKQVNNR